MPKLTTTMRPDQALDVSEQEATDLLRRGLVDKLDGKKISSEKATDKALDSLKDSGQPTG